MCSVVDLGRVIGRQASPFTSTANRRIRCRDSATFRRSQVASQQARHLSVSQPCPRLPQVGANILGRSDGRGRRRTHRSRAPRGGRVAGAACLVRGVTPVRRQNGRERGRSGGGGDSPPAVGQAGYRHDCAPAYGSPEPPPAPSVHRRAVVLPRRRTGRRRSHPAAARCALTSTQTNARGRESPLANPQSATLHRAPIQHHRFRREMHARVTAAPWDAGWLGRRACARRDARQATKRTRARCERRRR